jgi:hypothetical protein
MRSRLKHVSIYGSRVWFFFLLYELSKLILDPSFEKSGDEIKISRMNRGPQFCTGDETKSQDEKKEHGEGEEEEGGGQSGFLT